MEQDSAKYYDDPWVIPTVIAGLLWAWIYANPYGLLQYLVSIFSGGKITGFGILNNQSTALWGIIIAALWKQIPLMALLLLSGMQSIPDDMLEAAKIDGANYINCLFRIIIPHMKSVIAVNGFHVVLLKILNSIHYLQH